MARNYDIYVPISGLKLSTHPSLLVIVKKEYRKKVWAIMDDRHCVQSINGYALAMEDLATRILAMDLGEDITTHFRNTRSELGKAMKNVTKHTAEIWGMEPVRE